MKLFLTSLALFLFSLSYSQKLSYHVPKYNLRGSFLSVEKTEGKVKFKKDKIKIKTKDSTITILVVKDQARPTKSVSDEGKSVAYMGAVRTSNVYTVPQNCDVIVARNKKGKISSIFISYHDRNVEVFETEKQTNSILKRIYESKILDE